MARSSGTASTSRGSTTSDSRPSPACGPCRAAVSQPTTQLQRPGLLLMGGVVYAAFGSYCDVDPYRGWVVGVDAGTGAITTLWTDEALPPSVNASPRGVFAGM